MFLIRLAWKNMWRNRHRTVISMSAVFFAVILSILTSSLKNGIFDNLVKNVVSFYSGYIQVHKIGYWDEQILDNCFEASSQTEANILAEPGVQALTPRLESFALISAGDLAKGCLVVGIDPEQENRITQLRSKVIAGSYLKNKDTSVMLAEGLMKRLGVSLRDTIVLIGQGYHGAMAAGKYPISGILKFGSPELNDRGLFMPLSLASDLYSAPGMLTSYVLSLKRPKDLYTVTESVRKKAGAELEVMNWEEMMPQIKQHIETDTQNMQIVHYILYLLICFGVFGTLLMMMAERKYEMGMLLAIGMKKSKLILTMVVESVLTVLGGCLLGVMASIPVVYYLYENPIRISGKAAGAYERFGFEPVFPASLDPDKFISQALIVLILGLVLSLYPVIKIIRMVPVNAMRR